MILGTLQLELAIPGARSLKDKRRVVKSLKDRLHREHLVSVAEVAALDLPTTAILAVAVVSNSAPHAASVLERVLGKADALLDARVVDHQIDILRPADVPDELHDETTELAFMARASAKAEHS